MHLLLVVVYIFFWRSSAGQYTKHDFYLISIKNVDNIDGEHRVMRLARIFFCDWRHLRSRWAGFGRQSKKKEDGQGIVAAAALLFNAVATWSCLFSWSVGACASSDRVSLCGTDYTLYDTADYQQKLLKWEWNESPNREKGSKRGRKPIQKKILYLGLILTTGDTHTPVEEEEFSSSLF